MTDVNKITSLLIPMQQKPLLVPAVCVVEVMDYSRPAMVDSTVDWYLGSILWRGQKIPLISFERVNKGRFAEFSATARLAIFNSMTEHTTIPFYSMVVQGLPQSMDLKPQEIKATDTMPGVAETMRVIVHGLPSCIPNLEMVEKSLQKLFQAHENASRESVSVDPPKDTALA